MTTSLPQAKRQATIDVLARVTQELMIERGLEFTVDDVADAAQVSRSTVFRHFATRDDLVTAAVMIWRAEYVARMPAYVGQDWRVWLRELCAVIHEVNGRSGKLLMLATGGDGLSERLAPLGRELVEGRQRRYPRIAETLWQAERREGPVPDQLVLIVATYLGPLFTAAVRHEAGADSATAARMAERAIAEAVTGVTSD